MQSGDNVLIKAIVVSVDAKKGTARVSVGWGPHRHIFNVNQKLIEAAPSDELREAISWASKLLGDKGNEH